MHWIKSCPWWATWDQDSHFTQTHTLNHKCTQLAIIQSLNFLVDRETILSNITPSIYRWEIWAPDGWDHLLQVIRSKMMSLILSPALNCMLSLQPLHLPRVKHDSHSSELMFYPFNSMCMEFNNVPIRQTWKLRVREVKWQSQGRMFYSSRSTFPFVLRVLRLVDYAVFLGLLPELFVVKVAFMGNV